MWRLDGGVVLLGDPGSGKTTHLKQVLLQIKRHGAASIGLPEGTVPVFLPLRTLRDLEQGLSGFIQQELTDPLLDVRDGFGERLVRRGGLLFLLDGLDEVANAEDRRRVARWIEQARRGSADNYFLVSCRFSGYTPDAQLDDNFLELRLRPLTTEQVESFVHKWYGIVESATCEDAAQAEGRAERGARDLLTTLAKPEKSSQRVYTMTHNPLLLTTICLVHRDRGALPDKRIELYEEAVSVLLERWRRVTKDLPVTFPRSEARRVLQPVAAWMHEEPGRVRAKADALQGAVRQGLAEVNRRRVSASEFLETIRDESGLLTGWGVDEYGFMHLGFQEYLTALALRNQVLRDPDVLRQLASRFGDGWWQEVILLTLALTDPGVFEPFMAELVEQESFPEWSKSALMDLCWNEAASASAKPFVDALTRGSEKSGGWMARAWSWVRGPRRLEQAFVGRQLAAAQLLAKRAPEVLSELSPMLSAHPSSVVRDWWATRSAMGEFVDVLMHPKTGIELVAIPSGTFKMGSPEGVGRANEHPQHEVTLDGFRIARTPVTNDQYGRYLEAEPRANKPRYWGDRQYNQSEQPVVGVLWRDAMAYCEWAGLKLPTEAQWEYACRAGTETAYHSGESKDGLKRVGWYEDNSNRRLHMVGELEPNKWGLYDMHGNVWEWCMDGCPGMVEYESYETSPRTGDGLRLKPEGDAVRIMRGGSWYNDAIVARSAYRDGDRPGHRISSLGFRPVQGIDS